MGQSVVGRALTLHEADLGLIPNDPYGSPSLSGLTAEHRAEVCQMQVE